MKTLRFILIVGCLLPLQILAREELKTIIDSNSVFTKRFLRAVGSTDANTICSPLSAYLVLGMVHLGAGGETAAEIRTSLDLPDDLEVVKNGLKQLMDSLKHKDDYNTLEIANRVYVRRGFEVNKEYLNETHEIFGADAEVINFNSPYATLDINDWVAYQTGGKIKNLIAPGSLSGNTQMLLVNALYFKGRWKFQFNPGATQRRKFHLNQRNTVNIPMMRHKADYATGTFQNLGAKMLVIPYAGEKLSMVIALPTGFTALNELESSITELNLNDYIKRLAVSNVEIQIPKFKMEVAMNLNEPLQNMGMRKMFGSTADFSRLASREANSGNDGTAARKRRDSTDDYDDTDEIIILPTRSTTPPTVNPTTPRAPTTSRAPFSTRRPPLSSLNTGARPPIDAFGNANNGSPDDNRDPFVDRFNENHNNPPPASLFPSSSNRPLVISKVAQKAFIEVNEEGTEAAAATYAESIFLSLDMSSKFYVDRPFLFYVVHRPDDTSATILFSGKFFKPTNE